MLIGKINISPPTVLAPMAGITDGAFRILAKEQGAGLLVSEMVSSKGLFYQNQKTLDMIKFSDFERPFAVQLFGNDPKEMAFAAQKVAEFEPELIDVNMGCPVAKVVNNNEGSALLKQPKHAYEIIARMVEAVKIPITVKIRSGWDEENVNAVQMASLLEKAGAAAISLHARTRSQFYLGSANWQIIKKVKAQVKIPVIGNGDISSVADAQKMLEFTGCDGVMIGRAADGNPWIFSELKAFLKGEILPAPPLPEEKFALMLRHLELLIALKGESTAVKEMRRHASAYTKGLPYAGEFRNLFNHVTDSRSFSTVVHTYLAKLA